jgi:hypothetical protein
MEKLWKSPVVDVRTKVRILQASVISILLYGSETWLIPKQQMDSLDSFARSCYRIMLNIKRLDHVTNDDIYKRTDQLPFSDKIKRRQLTWVGHILRRDIEEPVRKYALYKPSEQLSSTKRGRKAIDFTTYVANIINAILTSARSSVGCASDFEYRVPGFKSWCRPKNLRSDKLSKSL